MALLRFLRSASLGTLGVLLYGYVDLVAPQWNFTAFLGCCRVAGFFQRFPSVEVVVFALWRSRLRVLRLLTVLSFGFGKHMEAVALAIAFSVAPYVKLERMYLAVFVAGLMALLAAKSTGGTNEEADGDMSWDNSAEARVRRILTEHAPHKLPKLPRILEKYGGDWHEVLNAAEAKYVFGTAAPTPFQTPSQTPKKEKAPALNIVSDEPVRQPRFDTPVASVPEDGEAGVEFLYEDEVLRPKEKSAEKTPSTRSSRSKSPSVLEEARSKALREQKERKTERIKKLRSRRSPQPKLG